MMNKNDKILVLGSAGLVGSHISEKLKELGYNNIVNHTRSDCDLLDQAAVKNYFFKHSFDYVFFAAAKVGGIIANSTKQADFLYQNLQIQNNVIHNAYLTKVQKLLFLGSSCIYPKNCPQPMKEEYLLTGDFEPTNFGYAIAKTAGIKMCYAYNLQYGTNFISVQPTNLYGPRDNFDLNNSHVLPALIRKFYEAKKSNKGEVVIWGTGNPRREFLHAKDMAEACIFVISSDNAAFKTLTNIGAGIDISIKELAYLIKEMVDFKGNISFDNSKPDGMMKKLLDVSKINSLGWYAKIDLKNGLQQTLNWYMHHGTP